MTDEHFVNDLTYYCRTVLNDMDQMVAVADSVAQQEVDSYATAGKLIPPTTDPLGRNLEAYTYIPSCCTVPLSMLCFSVVDFIGRLLDEGYRGERRTGVLIILFDMQGIFLNHLPDELIYSERRLRISLR